MTFWKYSVWALVSGCVGSLMSAYCIGYPYLGGVQVCGEWFGREGAGWLKRLSSLLAKFGTWNFTVCFS